MYFLSIGEICFFSLAIDTWNIVGGISLSSSVLLPRVLIFTQMSKMLDILEIFLNYHGMTYLRLDGSTPVQKRQVFYMSYSCIASQIIKC